MRVEKLKVRQLTENKDQQKHKAAIFIDKLVTEERQRAEGRRQKEVEGKRYKGMPFVLCHMGTSP
jgi:hypothetical protein